MDPKAQGFSDRLAEKSASLTPMVEPGLLAKAQSRMMRPRGPVIARAPMPGTFGISTVTKTSVEGPMPVTDLCAMHEDELPSSRRTKREIMKKAMVHPDMQHASETVSPAGWKQTLKDVPIAMLGGGVGYGIGKTLAEIIGDSVARGGVRPGWLSAMPVVTAGLSALGAFSAAQSRHGLAQRRMEAEQKA